MLIEVHGEQISALQNVSRGIGPQASSHRFSGIIYCDFPSAEGPQAGFGC